MGGRERKSTRERVDSGTKTEVSHEMCLVSRGFSRLREYSNEKPQVVVILDLEVSFRFAFSCGIPRFLCQNRGCALYFFACAGFLRDGRRCGVLVTQ